MNRVDHSMATEWQRQQNNLGNAQLDAGGSVQEWPEYGLEMVPVELHGEDTGRRLILREGNFIGDVTNRYKLLPNEEMVQAADAVAEELGAVPWNEFDGEWFIEMDEHVIMDDEGRRAHALYAWDDPVDTGDGDTIQMGFAVHNSIDASLGFHVGLFTFRHACANMVWMGVNGQGMGFDDREVLQSLSRKHTLGLDVNNLKEQIKAVLTLADDVSETYTAWREQFIEPEHVTGLIERVESGQLAQEDLPEWISGEGGVQEILEKAEENEQFESVEDPEAFRDRLIAAETPDDATVWEAYNDVTESVWHSDSTNDSSKTQKFKELHKVLQPAQGVR